MPYPAELWNLRHPLFKKEIEKKKGDRLSLGLWNDRTADSTIRCVSTYLMLGFVLLMRLFW